MKILNLFGRKYVQRHMAPACIPEPGQVVEIWYVRGLDGDWFATKMDAERTAGVAFPDEHPDKRYARVFYHRSHPRGQ